MKKFRGIASQGVVIFISVFFIIVQLRSFPKLSGPGNAEAIGFDIAWLVILVVALWVLLRYGLEVGRKCSHGKR